MSISAYPLGWPPGWKRTQSADRRPARFTRGERVYASDPGGVSYTRQKPISIADGRDRVLASLTRMGIPRDDIVISTNLELRLDGLPRSSPRAPADPGAAVYWNDYGDHRCLAIDHYTTVEDNLAAIAATLEALRAIERHGGAAILNRAFTGFTALPGPSTARPWREVFGFGPGDRVTLEIAKARYRELAQQHHPDREGGNADRMALVNRAWAEAQQSLGNG